jgi:hypothetical protein
MAAGVAAAGLAMAANAQAAVVVLNPDGVWDVQDQTMSVGDFFANTYQASTTELARFTDLDVASDQFGVYLNGVFVGNTPSVPDWNGLGASDPFQAPPFESDPGAAWASTAFSKGTLLLHAGDILSFTDIHIPPQADGTVFADGTIAVSAIAVPEPAAWTLMILGFAAVGALARRRTAAFA